LLENNAMQAPVLYPVQFKDAFFRSRHGAELQWRPGLLLAVCSGSSPSLVIVDRETGSVCSVAVDSVMFVGQLPAPLPAPSFPSTESALDAGIEQERQDRLESEQVQADTGFCQRMRQHLQEARDIAASFAAHSPDTRDSRTQLCEMLDAAMQACRARQWPAVLDPAVHGFVQALADAYLKLPLETRHSSTVIGRFRLGKPGESPLLEVLTFDGDPDTVAADCQLFQVHWKNGATRTVLVRKASRATTELFDQFAQEASLGGQEL